MIKKEMSIISSIRLIDPRMNVRWLHIDEQVQIIMKYVCHLLIHWIIILDIAEY